MCPHHARRRKPGGMHARMHGSMKLPEVEIDESTPLPYRIYHRLRSVMHAQKHVMFRMLGEKDTHPGQAITLWVLSANEGLSQSELAEKMMLARPTVTIMLKKMEKAGLIERRPDENDQRNKRIYLTDAGRALHEELRVVHAGVVEKTVGTMSAEDQAELERLLRVIEDNLSKEGSDEC